MIDTEKLQRLLDEAQATIHALQEELAETNRGLVALNLELDDRVVQRTAQLAEANQALRAEIAERQRIEEERERLLAERKRQSKFLESLIDNAPVGVAVVDRDMRFVLANPAYRSIAGSPDAPVAGRTVAEVFPPAVAQIVERFVQTVFASGELLQISEYETPIRGRTWWNVSEIPLRDAEGKVEDVLILTEEVTDRKQAAEALQESEQRFRTMAESIPQLAWIARADGWIFWYNQRWYEYTGTTPEQMEGWGWQSVPDPQILPTVLERWKGSIQSGERFDMIFPLRGADGVFRPFLTQAMPLKDKQGRVLQWFGTNTNISEQKAAEERLAAAKASAEQANRTKDRFLAVLSHELRTPLTPVVMGLSMLQDRPDLDPAMRETLEMFRRNVEMEARLIDDLLDVTRIAQGKVELQKQRVELRTVLERAVEVCKPDIEARQLHFGVDFGTAGPHWVEADVARLQQVFWNLLKNAIKFTPHGGCVGIRCHSNETHVLVEVNDSGIGIGPQALSRIFNAFEQAELSITRQFGGLGLGLAISKALVEMHGGTISAHSEGRDKGASFRVRLPLAAPASRSEAPTPATSSRRAVRPLCILLVEDHGVTAKMMRMVLASEGHTVELAGDVATALELANQHTFDLLLSDLGLPDGSGHDLMRQLRARGHQFPGIALSGYGQEEDIQRSHEAGFAAHLTKPASRETVIEALASATKEAAITHKRP